VLSVEEDLDVDGTVMAGDINLVLVHLRGEPGTAYTCGEMLTRYPLVVTFHSGEV
jgi:hypothetical protein